MPIKNITLTPNPSMDFLCSVTFILKVNLSNYLSIVNKVKSTYSVQPP